MNFKKGQTLELEITQIAFGGKGLARVDGMAIFVDQAVPNDRVIARIIKKKKSYAEARVIERIESSPKRVKAPCPYCGICGGCKLQFLGYEHQLKYKQQHVQESLEHIGQIKNLQINPAMASNKIFGYRNKMEFSCAERRWLLPEEMGCDDVDADMAIGLHVPGTFYKVLDIEACLLQPELGNHILSDVRQYIKKSPLPVYGLHSHKGFWRFLVLRHSAALDQWMVNIVTAEENRAKVQPLADLLSKKFKNVVSVVNNITSRKSGVAVGEREILLSGAPVIVDRIGDYKFEISANSFFQTNSLGAKQLYDTVKKYAALTGKETIVDLYCGAGTIAIYLADMVQQVIGMEISGSAIEDAKRNCVGNKIDNCRFIPGDIRYTLKQLYVRPQVMIIDPPRAGMHRDVVQRVMEIAPQKIVYVSCNPATMARDVEVLNELYRVMEVQPIDMFPHTFHIESVVKMLKR